MNISCSYAKLMGVNKLVPNPKNNNKHPEKQIEILAKLIDQHGFRHPIIVSKRSGFIVAGHGRLEAAKRLGLNEVPVDYQDFENEAMEYAFLIADNKSATMAEFDDAMLVETIKELEMEDFDFDLLSLPDFSLEIKDPEIKNTGAELNLDSFDNFDHQCPKCGFEWSDNGSNNS